MKVSRVVVVLVGISCSWLGAARQNPLRPGEKNSLNGDSAAIAAGAALYARSCASCHSIESRAPSLATGVFAHGGEDDQIAQTIRAGLPGTQMPAFPALRPEAVLQLVAYIRSLSNAGSRSAASGAGDAAAGERIFDGKGGCVVCHQVNARGGVVGPDLSAIGSARSAEALRQKIVSPGNPEAQGGRGAPPRPVVIVARTRDGREIRGVRRNEDTFSVHIVDGSGQLHLLDKATLADLQYEDRSLMPDDYGTRLAATELRDLLAYLRSLQARDMTRTAAAAIPGGLTYERIRQAASEPHNWLTYWGDYQGTHYSGLKEITTANVRQLQAKWTLQMPGQLDDRSDAARRRRHRLHERAAGNGRRARRADRPANLALSADAEGPQPERDQPVQPRRRGVGPPRVRRHAGRGAGRARCEERPAAVGSADGGRDAGVQHHQPAAADQGHDRRGHRRGRVRDPRVHRRVRRGHGPAPVALLHRPRARRIRARHVERRLVESGLWRDLAAGLV
jgi:putative heme-binding domain-containing protein